MGLYNTNNNIASHIYKPFLSVKAKVCNSVIFIGVSAMKLVYHKMYANFVSPAMYTLTSLLIQWLLA
ncbi:hypothetical protein T05_14029 [Trichinella murrelli]|uniref:Uncharacterized protein n=1 Tax=Trichinella murrelli TaxID=144512 RepID=A0A0V0T7B3_9BILA|nr:hypothetical protein T05_14029 [Trichinella murrelli]